MEKSKPCSEPGCLLIGHAFCDCDPSLRIFCEKHTMDHINNNPKLKHSLEILFTPLGSSELEKLI